jgi:hypothetical protein
MPDFRESKLWDKELEQDLPDCRLNYTNRDKAVVKRGRMEMDTVYCAMCSTASGLVPVHCPHVYFVCDICFFERMLGVDPPGTVQVSEQQMAALARDSGRT